MRGRVEAEPTVAYIAASRIPGQAANSFQVMKMAQALLVEVGGGLLIAARGEGAGAGGKNLRRQYGVKRMLPMRLLPLSGRFGIHLFNTRAALLAKRCGAKVVLSRSIGAAAIAARFGIPTVWECHAPPQGFEKVYWSILHKARAFRRLVVISDALREILSARFPETREVDVVVAHDGVDLDLYKSLPTPEEAKRVAGRSPSRPVAAYAGHLYAGRGIDIILKCAEALPEWSFVIAGGNPDDIAAVRERCDALGLSNVELIGFVENSELPARLAAADALLMPYQRKVMVSGGRLDTAQWMSPLKMFEYLAMGRAIVASDLPVLREVLDDEAAVLVPPDDVNAWVDALSRLYECKALQSQLAIAACLRSTEYTWTRRVRRILDGIV